jgi:CBS domain-containing membrane protein
MMASADLTGILQRLGLDANIGAADLARLIDEAHRQASEHLFDGVPCGQLMTRAVITLHPRMPLTQVAAVFREHRVRTLPVVGFDGVYQGLVSETDLLETLHRPLEKPAPGTFSRFLRAGRDVAAPVAADVMSRLAGTADEATSLGGLIDLLADGNQQAIPVLDGRRLIGLVTRSDLIAALAQAHKNDEVELSPDDRPRHDSDETPAP